MTCLTAPAWGLDHFILLSTASPSTLNPPHPSNLNKVYAVQSRAKRRARFEAWNRIVCYGHRSSAQTISCTYELLDKLGFWLISHGFIETRLHPFPFINWVEAVAFDSVISIVLIGPLNQYFSRNLESRSILLSRGSVHRLSNKVMRWHTLVTESQ